MEKAMINAGDSGASYTIRDGLRTEHRAIAAAGYWEAFSRKLRYPLGHVDKWRIHRRIEVMSMKPRKLWAVLS